MSAENQTEEQVRQKGGILLPLLLVVVVMGSGVGLSAYWLANKPKAERRPPKDTATLVETREVAPTAHRTRIDAMGTVLPSQSVGVAARVAGDVVEMNPSLVPGGVVEAGEVMLRIDPTDYELAVKQAEAGIQQLRANLQQQKQVIAQSRAALAQAQSELRLEMGRQKAAQREYEMMSDVLQEGDREFVLREPQLAAAEARRDSAQAGLAAAQAAVESTESALEAARLKLQKAQLDLSRTEVLAPMDAVVVARNIGLGSQASPGMSLVKLAAIDTYWVELLVPVGQLAWFTVPNTPDAGGAEVTLRHQSAWGKQTRRGEVRRLAPGLERSGRMARVIAEVRDPLARTDENHGKPKLLLDSFVRATIEGRLLDDVIVLPRIAVRDGGRVWVMTPEDTLDIRTVETVWEQQDVVVVSDGLRAGEQVVVSDLATPVDGMALRTQDEDNEDSEDDGETAPEAQESGE